MPVFRLFTLGEWSEPQILQAAANLGGIPGCKGGPLLCSPWCPIIAIVRAITRDLVPLAAAFCPWLLSRSDQALLALGQLSRFSLWALVGSSLPPPIGSFLFLLSTIASISLFPRSLVIALTEEEWGLFNWEEVSCS